MALPSSKIETKSLRRTAPGEDLFVAGVDEAGYGPKLGPLVVTLSAFRTGSAPIEEILEGVVKKKAPLDGPHVAVDDSKKIFKGRHRFEQLEKTALAFWFAAHGSWPATVGDLLEGIGTDDPDLPSCPWYGSDPSALRLPLALRSDRIAKSGELIRDALDLRGASFLGFRSQVATAPRFNSGVLSLENKAAFLADLALRLVRSSLSADLGRPALVLVDKLGGRNHYAHLLSAHFREDSLSVREEGRARSAYRLGDGDDRIEIRFDRSGDELHLPVALSSIFCKYVREIFMTLFNRFWTAMIPGLRPTAGYPTDAKRFLSDLGTVATGSGIDPEKFVRIR